MRGYSQTAVGNEYVYPQCISEQVCVVICASSLISPNVRGYSPVSDKPVELGLDAGASSLHMTDIRLLIVCPKDPVSGFC